MQQCQPTAGSSSCIAIANAASLHVAAGRYIRVSSYPQQDYVTAAQVQLHARLPLLKAAKPWNILALSMLLSTLEFFVLTFMAAACPGRHIAPAILENDSIPAAARRFSKLRLAGCTRQPCIPGSSTNAFHTYIYI